MAHADPSSTTAPPVAEDDRSAQPGAGHRSRSTWILVATAGVLLLVAGVLLYLRFAYAGRIYAGVRVDTVDVGGLTAAEALDALANARLDPDQPVVLRANGESWPLEPTSAGVALDARATVAEAYAVGRDGAPPVAMLRMLRSRFGGHEVSPSVVVDRDRLQDTVYAIADVFDRPAENAALAIDGTTISALESVTGQALDVNQAITTIEAAAARGDWPLDGLELPYNDIVPEVASADAAVAAAEGLLTSSIGLHDGSDAWSLEPEALAPMLTVTNSLGSVVLGLDEDRLAGWLGPVSDTISRTARLPRFQFDEGTGQLRLMEPGLSMRRIDVAETGRRVLAVGGVGPRAVPVAVNETPPAVPDTVTAAELGIVALVEEQTSRFSGSPAERIHNIALAAGRFNGVLVPPDAVFSFNEHVGDISAEAGYEETKIIMDGTTQDGVGGGVCQVSTTLFRTAFFAGLPIEERYPHGYRVAYYEQGAPVGLDATVYSPVVDLKFRNDTGAWLLVETETDAQASTTTFRFFGTRPDRQVALEGPVIGATTSPPEARVEIDPKLAPGASKVLEYARDGASVRVTRIITTGGQETREVFASHYRPTGLVTAVGPAPPTAVPADLVDPTGQLVGQGALPPEDPMPSEPSTGQGVAIP